MLLLPDHDDEIRFLSRPLYGQTSGRDLDGLTGGPVLLGEEDGGPDDQD